MSFQSCCYADKNLFRVSLFFVYLEQFVLEMQSDITSLMSLYCQDCSMQKWDSRDTEFLLVVYFRWAVCEWRWAQKLWWHRLHALTNLSFKIITDLCHLKWPEQHITSVSVW